MLTQNEIASLSLSPTKKDFVQIWNELLEVAGKLSERWDPTSTNESDPGIVILKALAGIADKLNYNIDKNTLEAFMPTAAQEDSMRKLCDMLGYNIKYYQAAKVDVTIKYHNADPSSEEAAALQKGLLLPKFSVITNTDQDINYFTTNEVPLYLTSTTPYIDVTCMEGQLVKCESLNDNHVITANQISENNRFYLPETQIAENGIFIYNVFNSSALTGSDELEDGTKWEKVENLNVQQHGSYVYKFGYDSYESRPYIEFPEDYGELFGDGIFIYYARTSGAAGNVSARTLTKLEFPSTGNWGDVASESISVENTFAATTGANVETIKQAYKNFKKTVGTFETLVTCRDYMNKIYSMLNYLGKPLVSNVLVTDIRNDLNRAITICSADRAGIFFKETPLISRTEKTIEDAPEYIPSEINKPKLANEAYEKITNRETRYTNWYIGTEDDRMYLFVDEYDNNLVSDADYEYFMSTTAKKYQKADGQEDFPTVEELGEVVAYTATEERSTYWIIKQGGRNFVTKLPIHWVDRAARTTKVEETSKINHFDLVLYPFKSYSQIKSNVKDVRSAYEASFKLNSGGTTFKEIKANLEADDIMAIAHNIKEPEAGDIVSINNYLKLDATVSTTSKITKEEGAIIIDKIKIALANAFNMRELDFGDEIPFESIVEIIENADARIRVVSLNEPGLYTTFSVLDSYNNSVPVIKEYAVESDHLTFEQAKDANRFDMDKVIYDEQNKPIPQSTFNTEEARQIYNELAARNVLAGRVPLFDYNTTFDTSFTEGAYQVTSVIPERPAELALPDKSTPFTVCEVNNKTYSGKLIDLPAGSSEVQRLADEELLEAPTNIGEKTTYVDPDTNEIYCCELSALGIPEYYKLMFMETFIPENFVNNVITKVENSNITNIETDCKIFAENGDILDVTLAAGEFVKFRAPNFTTIKTYPAYVNYHLELNKEILSNAKNAEADSLFSVLNSDKDAWTLTNKINNWQRVLNHFKKADSDEGRTEETSYVKTACQTQEISAYAPAAATNEATCTAAGNATKKHVDDGTGHCLYCGTAIISPIQKGPVVVSIDDKDSTDKKDLTDLLNKSGCLRFSDRHMKDATYNAETKMFEIPLILEWNVGDDEAAPSEKPDLDLLVSLSSPFITDQNVLSDINTAVQTRLEEMVGQVKEDGSTPMLPTECDWTITFEYECVPFEPASLSEWKTFVTSYYKELTGKNAEPFIENGTVFWRVYGEGYASGKYILQSSEKLLDFDRNYFGLLPDARLRGIYLISNPGADAQAALIVNDEEYRLRSNEYLYIEYTPSSTTEDGSTKEADAVTEIHGPGTIIKPSGFTAGLQDSSVLYNSGTSYHKTVTFETNTGTSKQVSMHKFNANEQVEIRDFARVELKKDSFKSTPAIYYYKNFDCDVLESGSGERKYTLKDGEYVFYTDSNKAELAYFTTGTEVILEGNVTLGKFESISLATIFDTGLNEIPWKYLGFSTNDDKVVFQEYQYITLGPEDCINKLTLLGNQKDYLDANWLYCDNVEYTLAGSEETTKLPAINTYDDRVELNKGCGWEVSSTLELDVSYNAAQTLRKTDKVETSITLKGTGSIGSGSTDGLTITPEDADHPLSFKTNLNCQTSNTNFSIDNVYNNPKKYKSFELKFFTSDAPVIVETLPGTVAPYDKTITDLTKWDGEPVSSSNSNSLWTEVALAKINVLDTNSETEKLCDRALRLPVSVLPETYGVFSIYLDSPAESTADVWIELLPGTSHDNITLFNRESSEIAWEIAPVGLKNGADKLMLRKGLNCIRVNATSRLFVKADVGATGSLFFDELKLVNCTPIEYSIADNKNIPINTYGLNIKQLGYLNPKDATTLSDILSKDEELAVAKSLAVDETLRETLKDGCVNEAKAALSKLSETSISDTKKNSYKKLIEVEPKLSNIKTFIDNAKKELDAMYKLITKINASTGNREFDATATTALKSLFTQYYALADEINREKALLKALNTNKSISAIENNFAELLNTFDTIEDTQEKLVEELNQLQTKAYAELTELTKDAVIKDFDSHISKSSAVFSDAFKDSLINQSKILIEKTYEEELIPLVTEITKVVNSEDRTSLFTILSLLKDDNVATERVKLLTIIKKILDKADSSELDSLLDTLLSAANGADMVTLNATTVRIEEYLKSSNFAALLAELETAFNNNEVDYLGDLLGELKTLANGTTITNSNITTAITGIKNTIKNNSLLATEPTAELLNTLVTNANNLYTHVNSDYKAKLKSLFEAAEAQLDELTPSDTCKNAMDALQSSKDAQVKAILDQIVEVSDKRETDMLKFDESKTGNFKATLNADITAKRVTSHEYFEGKLPYSEEAIYQAWKALIVSDVTSAIRSTVSDLDDKIKALSNTATAATAYTVSDLDIIAKSAAKLQAFADKVYETALRNEQTKAHLDYIASLSLPSSTDLTSLISTLSSEQEATNKRNQLIRAKINKYSAASTTRDKQAAIKELKNALTINIDALAPVVSAMLSMLCPSILLIEEKLPAAFDSDSAQADPVYQGWATEFMHARDVFATAAAITGNGNFQVGLEHALSVADRNLKSIKIFINALKTDNEFVKWLAKTEFEEDEPTVNEVVSLVQNRLPNKLRLALSDAKANSDTSKIALVLVDSNLKTDDIDEKLAAYVPIPECITTILRELTTTLAALDSTTTVADKSKDAYNLLIVEKQLLADIRRLDQTDAFYYTAPSDLSLAIEFNESNSARNTLMNPITNYDVNNINNNFVISKLDIDYLDKGIQIARSSRLN